MHAQPTRENIAAEERITSRFFPASATTERRVKDARGVFEPPCVQPPASKWLGFAALCAWYFFVLVTVFAVIAYLFAVLG